MRIVIIGVMTIAGMCGVAWHSDRPSISDLKSESLELKDVLSFLGLHAFKARINSDQPFNSLTVNISRYERQGNGEFRRMILGEPLEVVELQRVTSRIVSVMWREESGLLRFQVNSGDQGQIEFTVPANGLANYMPVDHGSGAGMRVDGRTIIAVNWRKSEHGTIVKAPELRHMQGYVAVEFELRDMKGLGD